MDRRRLTPSRNHFQSQHGGSRSAVFEQLLVILVTAHRTFNQKNSNDAQNRWTDVQTDAHTKYLKYSDKKPVYVKEDSND